MQPEHRLVVGLFIALVYLNLRYVINIIPLPDPFFDVDQYSSEVLGKHVLFKGMKPEDGHPAYGTDGDAMSLLKSEHKVGESIEFAEKRRNLEHNVVLSDAKSRKKYSGGAGLDNREPDDVKAGTKKKGATQPTQGASSSQLPDQVHEHTLHYPPWTHKASLHLTRRTLLNKDRLCEILTNFAPVHKKHFGSVVIDAGWWDVSDMYALSSEIFGSEQVVQAKKFPKRCILCRLAATCDTSERALSSEFAPTFSPSSQPEYLPVLLWSSGLVPTTDRRYQAAALRGYFIHNGDVLNANNNKQQGDDERGKFLKEAKQPLKFVWKRSETDEDGRGFHVEGALIDWSNPSAVSFFSQDAASIQHLHHNEGDPLAKVRPLGGFSDLLAQFDDLHGFRLGGVDSLIRNIRQGTSRVLGHKGHYSADSYSKDYYRVILDAGRRATTRINAFNRKLFERGEYELDDGLMAIVKEREAGTNAQREVKKISPPSREFVLFARAIDSHNQLHSFQSFAPPDTVAMAFTGDHELSYRDLRESALNTIHATYRCYSSMGTIIGSRHRTSVHSVIGDGSGFIDGSGGVGGSSDSHAAAAQTLSKKVLALEDGIVASRLEHVEGEKSPRKAEAAELAAHKETHVSCEDSIHSALGDQWFAFGTYLPGLFIPDSELHRLLPTKMKNNIPGKADIHKHSVANKNLLALMEDHNALVPYYSANAMQSFLFDVTSVHVPTSPSASFQQYQNPNGNPYCPVRHIPHFTYKLFQRTSTKAAAANADIGSGEKTKSATNTIVTYERNPKTHRDHFPHVLFQAPVDDFQFAVGPHFLAVPRLTLGATDRTISFPLLSPRSALRNQLGMASKGQVNSTVDEGEDFSSSAIGYQSPFIGIPNPNQWIDARVPYTLKALQPSVSKAKQIFSLDVDPSDTTDGEARADKSLLARDGTLNYYNGIRADLKATEVGHEGRLFMRRGALIPLLLPSLPSSTERSKIVAVDEEDILVFAVDAPHPSSTDDGTVIAVAATPFTYQDWRGAIATVSVFSQGPTSIPTVAFNYTPSTHLPEKGLTTSSSSGEASAPFTVRVAALSLTLPTSDANGDKKGVFALNQHKCWCDDDAVTDKEGVPLEEGEKGEGDGLEHLCAEAEEKKADEAPASLAARHAIRVDSGKLGALLVTEHTTGEVKDKGRCLLIKKVYADAKTLPLFQHLQLLVPAWLPAKCRCT